MGLSLSPLGQRYTVASVIPNRKQNSEVSDNGAEYIIFLFIFSPEESNDFYTASKRKIEGPNLIARLLLLTVTFRTS